jgi:hypothetical protein
MQIRLFFSFLLSIYCFFCNFQLCAGEFLTINLSSGTANIHFPISDLPNDFQPKPLGYHLEDENLQIVTDPFGNQIAAWLSHGIVFASIKPLGENWQLIPDQLSAKGELANDLNLATDSTGNILIIWQTLPSLSIQTAIKRIDSSWEINSLIHSDEMGFALQIAEGSPGFATATWKCYEDEKINMQLTEISLPLVSHSEGLNPSSEISIISENGSPPALNDWIEATLIENTDLFTLSEIISKGQKVGGMVFDETMTRVLGDEQHESNDILTIAQKLTEKINKSKSLVRVTSMKSSALEINNPLPSVLPFPPTNLHGQQVKNRFVTQADLVNVVTWEAATAGLSPIAFYVYRDPDLKHLAAIIPAEKKLQFKDHNRKPHHLYTYFIVAVDCHGVASPPAGIVFKGSKTCPIKATFPVSISIDPINPVINQGTNQQFVAIVTFSNGKVEILTTDITWDSSNTSVAIISDSGVATGSNSGTTTISGTIGNIASTTLLTIDSSKPTITTTSLPSGIVGTPYSQTIQATNIFPPITFNINGDLPPGLTFNPSTETISGIPTTVEISTFTVQATNRNGNSSTQTLTIIINCPAPTITTTSLPSGFDGVFYSETIQASDGIVPITFSLSMGILPPGLSLDSNTGAISGTPTTTGTFSFTVQVTSSCNVSSTQNLAIIINCPPPTITTTSLPSGLVGLLF